MYCEVLETESSPICQERGSDWKWRGAESNFRHVRPTLSPEADGRLEVHLTSQVIQQKRFPTRGGQWYLVAPAA